MARRLASTWPCSTCCHSGAPEGSQIAESSIFANVHESFASAFTASSTCLAWTAIIAEERTIWAVAYCHSLTSQSETINPWYRFSVVPRSARFHHASCPRLARLLTWAVIDAIHLCRVFYLQLDHLCQLRYAEMTGTCYYFLKPYSANGSPGYSPC